MRKRHCGYFEEILGTSVLLDEKATREPAEEKEFFRLLEEHATAKTIDRALRLRGTTKFRSEVLRKMHGGLLLRDALLRHTGNAKLDVYSGAAMIVRCSDGNARRLVQLFTAILRQAISTDKKVTVVSRRAQNELLANYGNEALSQSQSLPPVGKELFIILSQVGHELAARFMANRLSSDQITSIEVGKDDGKMIHQIVRLAVQGSMLVPADNRVLSQPTTPCDGVFHLAYVLAPHFHLLPRRNKSARLLSLIPQSISAKLYGQSAILLAEI